jgi:glycosyltransferase involved in cell wall biosynthesis
MKPLALIPAYNSAGFLPRLLPDIKNHIPDIVVVDDGSSDSTSQIAESRGANIIRHPANLGKGAALKSGFNFALENGYDIVITLDSDGQHKPQYIPSFLQTYASGGSDLIIGSRIRDKSDMPLPRRFSNWTTSHLLSRLMKVKIEDLQSGFRLYSRKLLESVSLESDHFELETEIVIKAIQAGMPPHFIPIKVEYGYGFPSHMNGFVDTLRWCRRVLELI